jgi:hypothetical protein
VVVEGCESDGYDRTQRAFVLSAQESEVTVRVDATEESPMVNPCFVIKNWDRNLKATLTINGDAVSTETDVRQGVIRDVDGSWTLIAWFNMESSDEVEFGFIGN